MARRDVSALASGTGGHVRLGAVVTIPEPLTANAVQLFLRRAPGASLLFIEATLDRLVKHLEDGDLDIALGRNRVISAQTPLKWELLLRKPFVFVTGTHHALGAPERVVDWSEVGSYRWITPPHGSPAYATLIETLMAHGIAPVAGSVESSSLALNLSLQESGDFVAILPSSIARQHTMRGTMRVLPLPPLEPLGEVVAYWRADATLPAVKLFAECLREASGEAHRE